MNEILDHVYYNNTVREYLISGSIILFGILLLLVFKKILIKYLEEWARKMPGNWDDFVVSVVKRFGIPIVQWVIIFWGINYLDLSDRIDRIVQIAIAVIVTYFILRLISSLIMLILESRVRRQERGEEKIKQLGGLMIVINIIIWALGLVFFFDNLGYNVTTIITGLGIGGIAIALAAQNVLGDLFSYFAIFFDKPFEAGDFIIVDDKLGSIEYVGLKTTHIRSLSGEQIVIGNSNLISSRIHNYKRMAKRRVVFTLNVEYGTPIGLIKKIPVLLRSIVEQQDLITFDRAHFGAYKDWSLQYEVVYYVLSPDYNVYMDIQQQINFQIYEEFEKLKIRFAIPTQSLYMKNEIDNKVSE